MNAAETVANATHHLQPLISDLGLILMTAGIAVLLFKKCIKNYEGAGS
mgnify:CR=1 FL=1